ncbi:MAG: LPS-assembly protein LptD, partial [Erythrobacter sp.]|nr:LPS-assembly protein LptD [Erythrobacter sp.]
MVPSRAYRIANATHLLGTGVAMLALVAAAPLAAQEGAATGTGTIEEPEGESPSDLPAPPDPVIIATQEDIPPPPPEFNKAGERQISFAADILSY